MVVVKPMHKLRQKIFMTNINNNGAGEKSNFSTDAQYRSKLGSPSAYAPEEDVSRASSSLYNKICKLYESAQQLIDTEEIEWLSPRKTKKLIIIT
jgi:hypothetical protein